VIGKYLAEGQPEPDLVEAVNLAIALNRPLLLEGDPGCDKTCLAEAVVYELSQRFSADVDEGATELAIAPAIGAGRKFVGGGY
jgi:ATP-dependent 26S proteasome regulatory subunit